jgi:hypothetical protein
VIYHIICGGVGGCGKTLEYDLREGWPEANRLERLPDGRYMGTIAALGSARAPHNHAGKDVTQRYKDIADAEAWLKELLS